MRGWSGLLGWLIWTRGPKAAGRERLTQNRALSG